MEQYVLDRPAVLVKRTTAKEQSRRLVTAAFTRPPAIVENHLNVLVQNERACMSVEAMSALLNTRPIDRLFRCLSGTVAVSASELAALPLPRPDAVAGILSSSDPDLLVEDAFELEVGT